MGYFGMSKLALKWALTKPPTTQYPFSPRVALTGSRGQLTFAIETCVYCNVCAKRCPTGALTVDRKQKRWMIDRLRCIVCGLCVEVCPKKSLDMTTGHAAPTVTRDREYYGVSP